jgi:hypothetical protein
VDPRRSKLWRLRHPTVSKEQDQFLPSPIPGLRRPQNATQRKRRETHISVGRITLQLQPQLFPDPTPGTITTYEVPALDVLCGDDVGVPSLSVGGSGRSLGRCEHVGPVQSRFEVGLGRWLGRRQTGERDGDGVRCGRVGGFGVRCWDGVAFDFETGCFGGVGRW